MNKNIWAKRLQKYVSSPLVIILGLYTIWGIIIKNSAGFEYICAGVSVLLVLGAFFYLKQMENVAEKNVKQRIQAEFPTESQPQVFEIYQRLKIKELEGLFLKILDNANVDLNKVKNLADVAESVGWKAFLEDRW